MSSDVDSSAVEEGAGAESPAVIPQPRRGDGEDSGAEVPGRRPAAGRRSARAFLTALRNRPTILGVQPRVLVILLVPALIGAIAALRWAFPFPPDSRYYTIMTLRDMGVSSRAALQRQADLTKWVSDPWYFSHADPVWRMVQPRMLYPFLSAPFVKVFGLTIGMMVVPILALLAAIIAVAALAQRLYGPTASLIAGGVLVATGALTANGLIIALTDPLAVGLFGLLLLVLPLGRRCNGRDLVFLGLLTVLLSLTRQLMPLLVPMVGLAWLWAWLFPEHGEKRRLRNDWLAPALVVGGIAVAFQTLVSALAPYDPTKQFLYASNEPSIGHAIQDLPKLAWGIFRVELSGMAHNDRFTLIVFCAPLALLLVRFRHQVTALYLGALLGVVTLAVANGLPSGMRYESVMFPIGALGVGLLAHKFTPAAASAGPAQAAAAPSRAARPSSRRETGGWLAGGVAFVALVVGWSATHGSASMVGEVPTSPAAAAALAGNPAATTPHTKAPGELTIGNVLRGARTTVRGLGSDLYLYLDWRHPLRYRPTAPGQPGWDDRAADGTTTIRFGDFTNPQTLQLARALSLDGTVDPDKVKVISRVAGVYGEDLVVEVTDAAGHKHRATATVVYPPHSSGVNILTQFVYES